MPEDARYSGFVFEGLEPRRSPSLLRKRLARVPRPGRSRALESRTVPALDESIDTPEALLLRQVVTSAGLDPRDYRLAPLLRRIPACLRALRAADCVEASQKLAADPGLLAPALNSLMIGVTEFFRDSATFAELRERIVPDLLGRCRTVRVWSAGCSYGAELYSVVMLFAEHGGLARGRFFGTDCRPAAIEAAGQGIYPTKMAETLPEEFQGKFFNTTAGSCIVAPALRAAPSWEAADILADEVPGVWDLVLCRNLAIYLAPRAVRLLWTKLAEALSPGGFLVAGKAERPRLPGLLQVGPCIYQKEPDGGRTPA